VSSKVPWVAFDVETTGLVAGVDRIVELAAVSFAGDELTGSVATLVDPSIPMPAAVTAVNGITDGMLVGKPPLEEALPPFLAFLERGTPIAHNAEFDVAFVAAAVERLGAHAPAGPVLDSRDLARRAFPGRVSYSLSNLTRDLSIDVDGAHRALADSISCMRLFRRCLAVLFPGSDPGPAEVLEKAGRRDAGGLDFGEHAPRTARIAALAQKAMDARGVLAITYRSARGELTERRIRPRAFTVTGGRVGVVAWCLLRDEERTFQLGSIVEARESP